MVNTKECDDKIRDIINWIQVKTLEELEAGEGKKIEEDTAKELQEMLRDLAKMIGKTNNSKKYCLI